EDEALFEVSTDKVDSEVPSPASGYLAEILVEEGETVDVGTKLAVVSSEAPSGDGQKAQAAEAAEPPEQQEEDEAAEEVPEDQASKDDEASEEEEARPAGAEAEAEQAKESERAPAPAPREEKREPRREEAPAPVGVAKAGADDEAIAFSNIRRRTAEHMVRSKSTSAHVLTAIEVDFENVDRVRRTAQGEWKEREGFTLTYLPFISRAVIDAIEDFPHVNASVGDDELVVHHRVHLGIAVDLSFQGLLAP